MPLGYAVIAQCGALTESYDLPDLDLAILVTPKHSTVEIQQLIGRITRRPLAATGKRWASVVTTDVLTDSIELANTIIAGVVRALIAQSDTFRHQLGNKVDSVRTQAVVTAEMRAKLQALGFAWRVTGPDGTRWAELAKGRELGFPPLVVTGWLPARRVTSLRGRQAAGRCCRCRSWCR